MKRQGVNMVNETIKTILKRRSIRSFKHNQINDEELKLIIKAGLFAPSAMNRQPCHITVLQDKKTIGKLNKTAKAFFEKSDDENLKARANSEKFDIFYNAPTVVIISVNDSDTFADIDSAAMQQNMLIAATSLNIGSCWIGASQFIFLTDAGKELMKELEIPSGYTPKNMFILGYTAGEDPEVPRRKENTVNFIR